MVRPSVTAPIVSVTTPGQLDDLDNVRQWKFKPYTMNGRPVSVQTNLTLKFAPAQ